MKRKRIIYLILIIITIILGLASRKFAEFLPHWIASYAGDTLWALMVFLIMGFIFNKLFTKYIAIFSLVFSYSIEISQLYHSPWIDAVRSTTLGGLVLGFGFLWSDLICYTVGIIIGSLLETILINRSK